MATSFLLAVKYLMGVNGISTHIQFIFPVLSYGREHWVTLPNNSTKESNDSV
jgi:hypothetical protein